MNKIRLEQGARVCLYVLAGMLPVWFVPQAPGVEFWRDVTFTFVIVLAAILWLLAALASGEVHYQHSPMWYAAGALVAIFGIATLSSRAPFVSFWSADPIAERFFTLILGVLLMGISGGVMRRRQEPRMLLAILLFSGAAAAFLTALHLFGDISLLRYLNVASGLEANVIGTINALALFYALLLMMSVGLLLGGGIQSRRARIALVVASALFLLALFTINFLTAWIAVLGSSVFLLGLLFIEDKIIMTRVPRLDWRQAAVLGFVILSAVMLRARGPVIISLNLPAEVSPSARSTLSVAASVFKEGTLRTFFGSGPGMFGLDWARYKDPTLGQTIFASIRFYQGHSWAATLLPTVGIAGFIAFVGFLALTLFILLRMLLTGVMTRGGVWRSAGDNLGDSESSHAIPARPESDPLANSVFLGLIALLVGVFLYPSNLSLTLLLFLIIGILTFLLARRGAGSGAEEQQKEALQGSGTSGGEEATRSKTDFWSVEERIIRFTAPAAVFISSLVVVFLIVLGAITLYGQVNRIRSAVALNRAVYALNQGDVEEAILRAEDSMRFEPRNFRNAEILARARMGKVRSLIQRATGGENLRAEFQSAVGLALESSRLAVSLYPEEPELWRLQGAIYELITPLVEGADGFADAAYRRASELEPSSPAIYVEWGRAGLAATDRMLALVNQGAENREELLRRREQRLGEISAILERAVKIRPDHATAHFLIAQTLIRRGQLEAAIQSAENAKQSAPSDIGVAFQLGLLYYQKDDLTRARAEFERAVSLNDNYANARYFLGLIRGRQGDRPGAIAEFEKIEQLNPGNQDVKAILNNLRAGKSALAGVVPPEERRETPLRQEEEKR